MSHDEDEGIFGLESLGSSPRELPLKLRVQLLTNMAFVIGGVVAGFGAGLATLALLSAHPLNDLRLALDRRSAPGQLVAIEKTHYSENETPVFRYSFNFQTPDKVGHQAVCYALGSPPDAPDPKLRPQVIVEYNPRHPDASRIQGMRVGVPDHGFTLLLLTPAIIGLVVLVAGLWRGRGRIRLLCHGELAQAQLISCKPTSNTDSDEVPFEQFRRSWSEKAPPIGSITNPTTGEVMTPRGVTMARGFMKLWTCGVVVVFGFGTMTLIAGMAMFLLANNAPMKFNGQPVSKVASLAAFLVLLVVWLVMGAVFLRFGRRPLAVVSGEASPSELNPAPWLQCTYEFPAPGGRVVRAKDQITFSSRLGDGSALPVLYDPGRPETAILLDGLSPGISVSPFGEWAATEGPSPWIRVGLVIASLTAWPWIAWWVWHKT